MTFLFILEVTDDTLSSHQAFLFNRYNSISSATALNLTPMFSGELYEEVDVEKIRQGMWVLDVDVGWLYRVELDRT